MPRNAHRPGASAAQSFRDDEIAALDELLRAMQRGAHPRDLARVIRSDAIARVHRKVLAMQQSLERQRREM